MIGWLRGRTTECIGQLGALETHNIVPAFPIIYYFPVFFGWLWVVKGFCCLTRQRSGSRWLGVVYPEINELRYRAMAGESFLAGKIIWWLFCQLHLFPDQSEVFGSKIYTQKWATHRLNLSTVCHESPCEWIFKSKDFLESQDTDLEMSQGSNAPKTRSSWRTIPLKIEMVQKPNFWGWPIIFKWLATLKS